MTTVGQDGATVARPSRTLTLGRALQAPTMMADGLAVGVLVIVCIVALTTFRAYGLGWDDYTHSQMGELLLRLYGSGFKDQRALSFVNLYMYGGGFDMLAALVAKVLPFDLFETRRLVGAAVGVVGLIAAWRTARRLGGPRAGFLAIVLLAACPLYFGHMFMNAKDAPFATAMAILAYGFVRLMQEYPTPQPSSIAWFGLGLGLSVGSRVLGDLSAISGAGALALTFGAEWRSLGLSTAARRIGRFILVLLPGLVLAYLIMGLIWPWSIVSFDNPLRALEYFSRFFEKPWRELFDGVRIPTIDMPRSYVPTLLALTLPEIFLLLSLGGVVATLAACFRRTITISTRASYVYLLLAALAPVAITVVERPAMYNGLRHFVFILPPLAVLAALAGIWLLDWLVARISASPRVILTASAAVLAIGLAFPVVAMTRLHPYEYAYYNSLVGGAPGARPLYMLDYWGLSFKQAGEELHAWLAERGETPPHGQWKIAVCGPHPPAHVALGSQFDLTWEPKGADFALMLGEFYCAQYDAPVVAEVKRDGVVFARVYDLRGRSESNIFTTPPLGQ